MEIRRTRKKQVWKIPKTFSSMVSFWPALVRDDMCSSIKDISTSQSGSNDDLARSLMKPPPDWTGDPCLLQQL
ncbi:unnamed protein product [Urochloa humidicola]